MSQFIEMQTLVHSNGDLEHGRGEIFKATPVTKKNEDLLQRIMLSIDEHVNVKILLRKWEPRLQFIVRLMLVTTFFDDSFRTASQFSDLIKEIGDQQFLKLFGLGINMRVFLATILLGTGLIIQLCSSVCLILLIHSDLATKALICWVIVQPVLYSQFSNVEFVAESISLLGGLFLIRARLVNSALSVADCARTQLMGRLLLPAMYLYYAGVFLFSAISLDETNSFAVYLSSLSMFVFNVIALALLAISSTFVAAGLKSRLVAVVLAFMNLCFVIYQHPFFRFVKLEDGEWKYDEDNIWMPNVAMPKDVTAFDFDVSQIYDLHKYYFFLGVSTSGALLLLAQFGPGEIAAQKDEVLLPVVARAQD